jgi:hypothetical protein
MPTNAIKAIGVDKLIGCEKKNKSKKIDKKS